MRGNINILSKTLVAAALTLSFEGLCLPAQARVILPSFFSDRLILQQGQSSNIWGKAAPGERVTVRYNGQTKFTTGNARGEWSTRLINLKPGKSSDLIVEGSNRIVLKDVQVGDVWFCSGQSNMNLPIDQTDCAPADLANLEKSDCRIFQADYLESKVNVESPPGRWLSPVATNVKSMPAIPLLMALKLSADRHIPVGVIVTACSGTPIQAFMPPETVRQILPAPPIIPTNYSTGSIFRSMLSPFLQFNVSGIVWYQGESNILDYERYKSYFLAFISGLRKSMGQGDLPFYFVQLPNHGTKTSQPSDSFWAEFRAAQAIALSLPETYMIVSIDTAKDPSLHPKSKKEIALRLAEAIESNRANEKLRQFVPQTLQVKDDILTLDFGSEKRFSTSDGFKATGFQLAAADRKFFPAESTYTNGKIKIQSDEVLEPVAARYAWGENPDCNLLLNGIPLAPFRTDKWKTNPQLNASNVIVNHVR